MKEDKVTIVRCCRCSRTGDITFRADRFWCGWCQDWASVVTESIENRVVSHHDGRPTLRSTTYPSLQPLRVTPGWSVLLNNGLYEVDPPAETISEEWRWSYFKSDMLYLEHQRSGSSLDVAWYPEGDMENGTFVLVLVANRDWQHPLHEFRTRDRIELVAEIERVLADVSG